MLILRSPREIAMMRIAGQCVAQAHQAVADLVAPGITTAQLDKAAEAVFDDAGAEPLFKDYPGPVPFPSVICASVNQAVVHGIPDDRPLQEGDIVSVDTGCRINGWCGDAAVTHAIGKVARRTQELLDITQGALQLAIDLLARKSRWSEVAVEMQAYVEGAGFSVVKQFIGHGIGHEMHEKPDVPNFDSRELREKRDFRLKSGLVLAIEPMVCVGSDKIKCHDDQWTQLTADGKNAAHFEHTVALTSDGPEILTQLGPS